MYKNANVVTELFEDIKFIEIKQGVRQGDPFSHKLFTNTPEDIFKIFHWERKKININCERLTNLTRSHGTRTTNDHTRSRT